MNHFLRDNVAYGYAFDLPSEFQDDFSPVLSYADKSVGSVGATLSGGDECSIELPSHLIT